LENVSELKETHTKKLENCELFFLLPAIVLRQEKTQKKSRWRASKVCK